MRSSLLVPKPESSTANGLRGASTTAPKTAPDRRALPARKVSIGDHRDAIEFAIPDGDTLALAVVIRSEVGHEFAVRVTEHEGTLYEARVEINVSMPSMDVTDDLIVHAPASNDGHCIARTRITSILRPSTATSRGDRARWLDDDSNWNVGPVSIDHDDCADGVDCDGGDMPLTMRRIEVSSTAVRTQMTIDAVREVIHLRSLAERGQMPRDRVFAEEVLDGEINAMIENSRVPLKAFAV